LTGKIEEVTFAQNGFLFSGNFSNLPNCRFVELKLVALVSSPWALIGFVTSCRKFEVEVEDLCRQGKIVAKIPSKMRKFSAFLIRPRPKVGF
jgi:hypothetical protein